MLLRVTKTLPFFDVEHQIVYVGEFVSETDIAITIRTPYGIAITFVKKDNIRVEREDV